MSKCEICGRELALNEDHRNCVIKDYAKCIEDLKNHQTQKAIECLREMKENLWKERYPNKYGDVVDMIDINFYIDTKIKELEEGNGEN